MIYPKKLHFGQAIYTIKDDRIERELVFCVLNPKQVLVRKGSTFYAFTYGRDFSLTHKKAELLLENIREFDFYIRKVNKIKQEKERAVKEKPLQVKREKPNEGNKQKVVNICGSCGIPIGNFGHCGCS